MPPVVNVPAAIKTARKAQIVPLRPFHAALARRSADPVDILCIGDSLTEGARVSTLEKRWVALLREKLRARFPTPGVTGGVGYLCADYYAAGTNTDLEAFTQTGGVSDTGASDFKGRFGLGRRARVLSTVGDALSITVTCSSFDVIYKANLGGATSLDVAIDGGLATTVSTVDAVTAAEGTRWNSGALTPGSHSIVITQKVGTTYVEGMMVYLGDEAAGIRMWESGQGGARSWSFNSPDNIWIVCVKTAFPSLVLIELGCNDWWYNSGGTAPYGTYTPAAMVSNLTTLISAVKAQLAYATSVGIVIAHERGDGGLAAGTIPLLAWSEYVAAYYGMVTADPSLFLVDMNNALGPSPASAPGSQSMIATDKVHLNDYGSELYADAIFRAITGGAF